MNPKMKKRKIKFKDGSIGSFTPENKPQLTMFSCDRGNDCVGGETDGKNTFPARLNTSEYQHGNTCSKCIAAEKLKHDKQAINMMRKTSKNNENELNNAMLNLTNMLPDIIPLESKTVNYCGSNYTVEVFNAKDSRFPNIKICNSEGVIVHLTGSIETKEGRDIFYYCKTNRDDKDKPIIPNNSI